MPWRKLIDCCVREIVKDDFAKVGAVLRHGACASLAKSNAMALADNESVAGCGAPARTFTDGQACRFRVILLRARLPEVRLRGARGWQASDVKELQFSDVEKAKALCVPATCRSRFVSAGRAAALDNFLAGIREPQEEP
jgi:hypothetical protein